MYSTLEGLLKSLDSDNNSKIEFTQTDSRTVMGVLFFLVIQADGRIRKEETELYEELLETYLKISEDERELFERNVASRLESTDAVEQLTAELVELPESKKQEIVDLMHDISISDRELHEVELALIEKVKEMLGLVYQS